MPKMKTRKSASKRYKITGTGKILRRKAGISHLKEHKLPKAKNDNKGFIEVSKGDSYKIKKMLPYA